MAMKQELHDALLTRNKQVPRYTSYPTAPHFSANVGATTVDRWLSEIEDDARLSLYFHVPFCRKMCWYCGCHTKATRRYNPVEAYLEHLLKEVELVAARLSGDQTVSHIHFGGGSPSMLTPDDFTRIMDTVRTHFAMSPEVEIAIELDPREVTEVKVAAYAKAGVTRASLGVQDFHEEVQVAINRRQPFPLVYDAVNLLRAYGIRDINMDLLYGLPHQTTERIRDNVNFATALGPSRISLFGYAHVPWMKRHMRLIDTAALPDGTERLRQFDEATKQLKSRGYVPIGLDHFVLPTDSMARAQAEGKLHRNFQGYTTDTADALIGFGASAISALPQGYTQNSSANHDYFAAISEGRLATCKGKALSDDDKIRRDIIEQLMCNFRIDLDGFCAERGVDIAEFSAALTELKELEKDGLVRVQGGLIEVPEEARQAVRLACAAFDAYLVVREGQHAQVA